MIHLYIGDGKGKTSAALGLAVRAAGAGLKVAIVFFDKGEEAGHKAQRRYSERRILRQIPNVDVHSSGLARFCSGRPFRLEMTNEDIKEARRGYDLAADLIRGKGHSVVILDEILGLVKAGALEEKQVISLFELARRPPETELILTGRVDSPALIRQADLVTEMRKIKHYFDSGARARKGIEY